MIVLPYTNHIVESPLIQEKWITYTKGITYMKTKLFLKYRTPKHITEIILKPFLKRYDNEFKERQKQPSKS